jgi:hypothetical protein
VNPPAKKPSLAQDSPVAAAAASIINADNTNANKERDAKVKVNKTKEA